MSQRADSDCTAQEMLPEGVLNQVGDVTSMRVDEVDEPDDVVVVVLVDVALVVVVDDSLEDVDPQAAASDIATEIAAIATQRRTDLTTTECAVPRCCG